MRFVFGDRRRGRSIVALLLACVLLAPAGPVRAATSAPQGRESVAPMPDPMAGVAPSRPPKPLGTEVAKRAGEESGLTPARPPHSVSHGRLMKIGFFDQVAGARVTDGSKSIAFHLEGVNYDGYHRVGNRTTYSGSGRPTVRYTQTTDSLKEEIVFDRRSALGPLAFVVETSGVRVVPNADGWDVRAGPAVLWRIQKPFVVDAAGRTGAVKVEITGNRWVYLVDPDFLSTAKYPITVDPTLSPVSTVPQSHPSTRRAFKLSDGTAVTAWWDGTSTVFKTAASPYTTWSATTTVAATLDDFAAVTDGSNGLWFAYRDAASALSVVKADRSAGVWTVGTPVVVDSGETHSPGLTRSSGGTLVVSFQRLTSGTLNELRLATSTNSGATWTTETPASLAGESQAAASTPTFVGSSLGVAYNDGAGQLRWRTRPSSGGSWSGATNLGAVNADRFSLASDGSSTLFLASQTAAGGAIAYRSLTSGTWGSEISLAATATDGPTLSTDGTKVWVLYTRTIGPRQSQLLYRVWNGTAWGAEANWVGLPAARTFDRVWDHNTGTALPPDGEWNDRTAAASNTADADTGFANNNGDELYLGLAVPFSQARFSFGIFGAVPSIAPTFEYWNGTAWTALTSAGDALNDRTDGMQHSANVSWVNPTNSDGTLKWQTIPDASGPLYYIRVTRTASATVPPKAMQVTAAPYVLAPSSAERDAGLVSLTWSQSDLDDSAYDVTFDAIDLTPPAVTLTSPTSGTISGDITSTVTASDNYAGVAKVGFWARPRFSDSSTGTWRFLGSDTTSPFSLDWRTLSIADGSIDLAVTAADRQGNLANGDLATTTAVTVNNADPLGRQGYASIWQRSIGDHLTLGVNRFSGNLLATFDGGAVVAPGPEQSGSIGYNSRSRDTGELGFGWSLAALSSLTVNADGSVTAHVGDGGRYHFTTSGGNFVHPTGVFLGLVLNGDGTYDLTDKTGLTSHYDSSGKLLSVTDRNGRSTTYSTSGTTTTITYAGSRTTTLTRTSGKITSIALSGTGTDASTTTATTSLAYDSVGNLQTITDAAGAVWTFAYDGDHRLVSVTDARSKVWVVRYASAEQADWASSITDPTNRIDSFAYGTTNHAQRSNTNGAGDTELLTFDAAGAATAEVDGEGNSRTFTRDGDENVTQTTIDMPPAVADIVTSATWDARGNQLTSVDGRGKTTTYVYNTMNELTSVTDPLGHQTTHTYDSTGNLLTTVSARGNEGGATASSYTTTYTYDSAAPHDQLTMVDPPHDGFSASARTWTYTHDGSGRTLTQTAPPTGSQTHVTYSDYDGLGRRVATRDPRSTSSTDNTYKTFSTFDGVGRLLTQTQPATGTQLHITRWTYDPNGNQTSQRDPRSASSSDNTYVTTTAYDDAGRISTATKPATGGGSQTHVTTSTYDGAGRLASTTDPSNAGTSYSYWHNGLLKTETDALSHTTTFFYDVAGRQVKVEAPATSSQTHISYTGYDDAGNQTSTTDERATSPGDATYTVKFVFDDAGRMVRTEVPLSGMSPRSGSGCATHTSCSTYGYDAENHRTTSIDARGNVSSATASDFTTTTSFDSSGRTSSRAVPSRGTTTFAFDAAGRKASQTDPLSNTTAFGYDAADHLTSVTDPAGAKTTYAYDELGRKTESVEPRGNESGAASADYMTEYSYDEAGHLTEVTAPKISGVSGELNNVTAYTYDELGRRNSVTDPRGNISRVAYDASGRITLITDGAGNSEAFAYDAAGNQTDKTTNVASGSGTTAVHTAQLFDALNRVVTVTYDDNNPATTDPTKSFVYDAVSHVTAASNDAGSVDSTYNPAGWQTSDVGPASAASYTTFDAVGDVTTTQNTTLAATTSFAYGWRADRQVKARCDVNPCPDSPLAGGTTEFGYDSAGHRTSVALPDGRIDEADFNAVGRVGALRLKSSSTTTELTWTLTYDAVGHPIEVSPSTTGGATGGDDHAYTWDKAGLLLSEKYPVTSSPTGSNWATYSYDAAGNVKEKNVSASSPAVSAPSIASGRLAQYSYDRANRLTQAVTVDNATGLTQADTRFLYNERGDLTQAIGTDAALYEWDRDDRLTRAAKGLSIVTYTYDAYGRRIRKQLGTGPTAVVTTYRWNGSQLLAILNGEGSAASIATTFSYDPDGRPWSFTIPGTGTYIYHYDAFGNVERISNSAGAIVARYQYDAKGSLLDTIHGSAWSDAVDAKNPYRFSAAAGAIVDLDTGLYMRDGMPYDPGLGRFLSGSHGAVRGETEGAPEARGGPDLGCPVKWFALDRASMENYLLNYSSSPNSAYYYFNNDCTSFTSQVLFSGGWWMDHLTTRREATSAYINNNSSPSTTWWYESGSSYSSSWAVVQALGNYLTNHGGGQFGPTVGGSTSDYPAFASLRPGDPVFVDKDGNGGSDHTMTYRYSDPEPHFAQHGGGPRDEYDRRMSDLMKANPKAKFKGFHLDEVVTSDVECWITWLGW